MMGYSSGTMPVYNGGNTNMMGTVMPMPMGQQMFSYGASKQPVMGTDVSDMMPIGIGSVAMGGTMFDIQAQTNQFAGPMDMYLFMYAPAVDPLNIYNMLPNGSLQPISMGLMPWQSGVTGVDQTIINNVPTSLLPRGTYMLGLMATPSGSNLSTYYMWMTNFTIQ